MTDTRTRVAAIVVKSCAIDAREFDDDDTFADLGADSIDRIELVMALEEEFAVEITDDEWMRVGTFGDTVAIVERKLAGVAA